MSYVVTGLELIVFADMEEKHVLALSSETNDPVKTIPYRS